MMESIKRFIVGTAGHIHHGKSPLIEALTGVNLDQLKEVMTLATRTCDAGHQWEGGLQIQDGDQHARVAGIAGVKFKMPCQRPHPFVFMEDVGDYLPDFLRAAHFNQSAHYFSPEPLLLEAVTDQHGNFCLGCSGDFRQLANSAYFVLACPGVLVVHHQRHFMVIVNEAFLDQPIVRHARTEFLHVKKAQVHGFL
jgi:hypothetical protein